MVKRSNRDESISFHTINLLYYSIYEREYNVSPSTTHDGVIPLRVFPTDTSELVGLFFRFNRHDPESKSPSTVSEVGAHTINIPIYIMTLSYPIYRIRDG